MDRVETDPKIVISDDLARKGQVAMYRVEMIDLAVALAMMRMILRQLHVPVVASEVPVHDQTAEAMRGPPVDEASEDVPSLFLKLLFDHGKTIMKLTDGGVNGDVVVVWHVSALAFPVTTRIVLQVDI